MAKDYPDFTFTTHVRTLAADNIVIDKLTVGAYTENRRTLSNNGATPGWLSPTGNERRGKFFPRGCRGWIESIEVYCKDAGAAGGTITVYISPHPNMGYITSVTITVPPGGSADWRSATLNQMWNYDSLFIFAVCSTSDIYLAWDAGTPWDEYTSSDAGATWAVGPARYWFRVVMKGQTVGDVPVSGTLNVVIMPTKTSRTESGTVTIPTDTETTLIEIDGAGEVLSIRWLTNHDMVEIRVYCDGRIVEAISGFLLYGLGHTSSTPVLPLTKYTSGGSCAGLIDSSFAFLRQLKVTAYHTTNVDRTATVVGIVKSL